MKLVSLTLVGFGVAAGALALGHHAHAASSASSVAAPADGLPAFVEKASHKVTLNPAKEYKKGDVASFEVVLSALGDYHVNPEYPAKFVPTDKPVGVSYPATKIARAEKADAFTEEACKSGKDKCTLHVKVPVKIEATTAKVGGTLYFGVCNASQCLIEKAPLEVAITVK